MPTRDTADRTTRLDRCRRRGAVRLDRVQPVPGGGRRRRAARLPPHQGRARDRRGAAASRWSRTSGSGPFALVRSDDALHETLEKLQRRGAHMARVVDATRRTVGVATLEDVIEELVGEIRDSAHPGAHSPPAGPDAPPGDLRDAWARTARVSPAAAGESRVSADEGAGGSGGRDLTRPARVDRPERAELLAPAGRSALPVAGARCPRPTAGRSACSCLRHHRLPRRLPRPPTRPDLEARADPRPGRRPPLHPGGRDRTGTA